ncbi:MAG: ubiquinone biosynthesis protein [Bacteriovoracaceae bacterium]|jgi:ubiquinone biosynthesis protein
MNLIKTGIGISKTIKNVARFREILSVMARHGFDEFIIKTKLHLVIPNFVIPKARFKISEDQSDYAFWKSVGFRLRKSFEELGPSFIKVGQLLATREDILDPALISELKLLQNHALTIPFQDAKKRIQEEIGKPIDEIFKSLEEVPIGVASIGVVYRGVLLDGRKVVVKVRRPNIRKTINNDFEIIAFIVGQLEKALPEVKFLGLSRAIDDFFKSIQLELNFLIEANNNKKIKENIQKIDTENILVIPEIHREFSTQKILVMEFLEGIQFNEIRNIEEHPVLKENLTKGVKLFMHNMLADGIFHADLHGGNFFKLENNKIGLIDFGLVGVLGKENRTNLIAILFALLTNNYENLVLEFLDVADYEVMPNHDALVRDIRDALAPYIGLSVQETDATALTHALVSTLGRHQVYLPREWFIIFRALMTLDGVGKSLDIDLNIFEIIESEIQTIMGDLFSKEALMEDAAWVGRDVLNSLRIIPRHLKWILKEFSKRNYQFDLKLVGTNKEINLLSRSIYFLGLMVLASTFFISGTLILGDIKATTFQEIPIPSYICWGLAGLAFFRGSLIYKVR